MKVDMYWIDHGRDGRLAIMPRPRAGDWLEDELAAWHHAGVNCIVSLLTPFEIFELGLEREPAVCQQIGIDYLSLPIPDRQVPRSMTTVQETISKIEARLLKNQGVAIHCRMGVGRSAMIAACVLRRQGLTTQQAFAAISQARGIRTPDTAEQIRWVDDIFY